jgi:preprotein translocase subunit YajC
MADVLYAQTTTASAASVASSPLSMVTSFAPFIIIMGLFYFLMIAPQNKERKKKEEQLNAVQRGDRVLTRGGIYGTVADIKENILILKISENVKIEIEKTYYTPLFFRRAAFLFCR